MDSSSVAAPMAATKCFACQGELEKILLAAPMSGGISSSSNVAQLEMKYLTSSNAFVGTVKARKCRSCGLIALFG